MIACLSPTDSNYEESLSTLKYAHNTKFINNRPVVNEELDPKDELIKELQKEITFLRHRLKEWNICPEKHISNKSLFFSLV